MPENKSANNKPLDYSTYKHVEYAIDTRGVKLAGDLMVYIEMLITELKSGKTTRPHAKSNEQLYSELNNAVNAYSQIFGVFNLSGATAFIDNFRANKGANNNGTDDILNTESENTENV